MTVTTFPKSFLPFRPVNYDVFGVEVVDNFSYYFRWGSLSSSCNLLYYVHFMKGSTFYVAIEVFISIILVKVMIMIAEITTMDPLSTGTDLSRYKPSLPVRVHSRRLSC